MNREDILRMGRQAGAFIELAQEKDLLWLERFANLVSKHTLANSFMSWQEGYEAGKQDGKCKYCIDGCPACDARKLPEQERFLVATIGNWGRVEWADGVFPSLGDKMYSAPRTWVGLTDEEVGNLSDFAYANDEEFVRNVEKHLKEKNSG